MIGGPPAECYISKVSRIIRNLLSVKRSENICEGKLKMHDEKSNYQTSSVASSPSTRVKRIADRFWMLNRPKRGGWHNVRDGLCQCRTEDIIRRSADPSEMRAFLMVSVFVDQMIYTHYQHWYEKFRAKRRFPKLYSHGGFGMMPASWLVYHVHGYDAELDWGRAQNVVSLIISDAFRIVKLNSDDRFDEFEFLEIAGHEIRAEFPPQTSDKFLNLVQHAINECNA
jgi:hypothetical protein